jgi:hypothetical protein
MDNDDKTAPNADNPDLPDKVPDPMTDDKDAGELETDQHGDPDQVT